MSLRRGSSGLTELLKGKRSDSIKTDESGKPHLDFELEEGVNLRIKYLGACPVANHSDLPSVCQALDNMKLRSPDKRKVVLSVSTRGLKIIDEKTKATLQEHGVKHITIVTTEPGDDRYLAYVARDTDRRSFSAHCFESKKVSTEVIANDIGRSFQLAAKNEQNPKERVDVKVATMRRMSTAGQLMRLTRQDFEPQQASLPGIYHEPVRRRDDDDVYDVPKPGGAVVYESPVHMTAPEYDMPAAKPLNYATLSFPDGTPAVPGGSIALRRLSNAAAQMRRGSSASDEGRLSKSSSADALEAQKGEAPKSPRSPRSVSSLDGIGTTFKNSLYNSVPGTPGRLTPDLLGTSYDAIPGRGGAAAGDASDDDEVYGTTDAHARDSYDALPQKKSPEPLPKTVKVSETEQGDSYDALPPVLPLKKSPEPLPKAAKATEGDTYDAIPPTSAAAGSSTAPTPSAAPSITSPSPTSEDVPPPLPSRARRATLSNAEFEAPPAQAVARQKSETSVVPTLAVQPEPEAPPVVSRAVKPRLSVGAWDAPRPLSIVRQNALKAEVCSTCRDHFKWIACPLCSSEFPGSAGFSFCGYCGTKLAQ